MDVARTRVSFRALEVLSFARQTPFILFFFFKGSGAPRDLPSSPTRRSSDLNGLTFRRPPLAIPGLFSVPFSPETLHWFVLAVVTASYLILRRITQSPFGMVLQSIRENEPRTSAIGYAVERYKIVAVMLAARFAGLAGVLYALQNRFAAPDFVYFLVSGETVIFNVMGGIGTLVGPIVGAGFFLLLREAFSRFFTEYYLIPVGVIFIAMVIFMPQGLLGFMRRWLNQ